MGGESPITGVESVCVLVVTPGPFGIISGPQRLVVFVMLDEPVRVLAHEKGIARGEKGCSPEAWDKTGLTNFFCELFQSAGKFCISAIPIAECRLIAIVELHHCD